MLALHTTRKSRWDDNTAARAVMQTLTGAPGVSQMLPVIGNGRVLGMAKGRGTHVDYVPLIGSPYNSYDDFVDQMTQATPRRFGFHYEKSHDTRVANRWYDLWPLRGNPTRGTYPGTARTARQLDDTTTGAVAFGGNVSPKERYLISTTGWSNIAQRGILLYDRVLTYENCTYTAGSQSMTNVLTAQRYISTGQPGLQIMVTADAVQNATAANLTVCTYTDNDGNTGQLVVTTPTLARVTAVTAPSASTPATIVVPYSGTNNRQIFLPLAAGDTGVRSIADYTWSAAPTGTNTFALVYPIAWVTEMMSATFAQITELVNSIGGASRVYDGACLAAAMFMTNANAGGVFFEGELGYTST